MMKKNTKLKCRVTAAEIKALHDPKMQKKIMKLAKAAMVDLGPTNAVELVHNSR